MSDQDAALRNLILRSSRQARRTVGAPPRVAWVVGGQPGVGSTSLAVGTSLVAAEQGYQVILLNASPQSKLIQRLTDQQIPMDCWLTDRREIHEVLSPGPWGLQIAGNLGQAHKQPLTEDDSAWLYRQLCTLGRHADCVLIEGWPQHRESALRLWELASHVILVTTPDARSIMHTYARLKTLVSHSPATPAWLVMNRTRRTMVDSAKVARLLDSCERFLNYRLIDWERLPEDEEIASWLSRPRSQANCVGRGLLGRMRRMAVDLCTPASQASTDAGVRRENRGSDSLRKGRAA